MGGRASRQKGTRGEAELVDLCTKKGVTSQRVMGSGSFIGAKADVKIGVFPDAQGNIPDRDESTCVMRGEIKNRKDNPDRIWTYLNQDKETKVLFLRRPRVPQGALAKEDLNQVWVAVMGLDDFLELFKKAYPEFDKIKE